jgi:hypothetical protein
MGPADYADQRYYSSAYGRFNTVDPARSADAKNPLSWNRYAYVGGDPVNRFDPRGLCVTDSQGNYWDNGDDVAYDWGVGDCEDNPEWVSWVSTLAPGSIMLNGGPYYPGGDSGGGDGGGAAPAQTAPAAPSKSQQPKCWQNVGNISATLSNLGTDIEQDVSGQFSSADLQAITSDINSDIGSEMAAIGGGTTSSPYYIGGHFNFDISDSQIAALSATDAAFFSSIFAGTTSDGVRQPASTGLAAAGNYTLHSHDDDTPNNYSFHFDRFNPLSDVSGLVGHGVYDVLGGHLGHPCLDPAWH